MKQYKNIQEKFIKKLPEAEICLLGLEGSRAFGLERPDCDWDYRGIYIATNEKMLSLGKPKEQYEYNDKELDYVIYELEKFFRLAMKCNPSILQFLYLSKYSFINNVGREIVANRELFLNEKHIRNGYSGYALSQILYLKRNHKFKNCQKIKKHIRHCFRLFDQGQELLTTGKITVKLANPQKYFDIADMTNEKNGEEKIVKLFEERDKEFKKCKSVISDTTNNFLINKLLLKIRFGKKC